MARRGKSRPRRDGAIKLPPGALGGLRSGVLAVDPDGDITEANATFCQLVGTETCEGVNIRDLIPNDTTYRQVAARLKRRLSELVAEEYSTTVNRLDDGTPVPVDIVAFPETDASGAAVGALAIVRDASLREPAERIHEAIETERDWRAMFRAVAHAVRMIVPFDWFSVTLYSDDGKHLRELFSIADDTLPAWGVRWYEMPAVVLRNVEKREPMMVDDFDEFFAQPEWRPLLDDPDTAQFLSLGYRSSLWYPVIQEGNVVAAITLYRKVRAGYAERHLEYIRALPLRRAVAMALTHLQREDVEFRLDLIKQLAAVGSCGDVRKSGDSEIEGVAKLLVDRIKTHYGWSNVSLFRVDADQSRFVLIDESYDNLEHAFGAGYEQPLSEGVLGYVFDTRESVRSGNMPEDPVLRGRFHKGLRGTTLSELAIPIRVEDKICAILNSEDRQKNAYSRTEQIALETVLGEVATLYRRIELQRLLNAILESARDAIIRTDGRRIIRWVNASTVQILGGPEDRLIGTSLGDHIADPESARFFLLSDNVTSDQLTFRRADGSVCDLLVSGSALPQEMGGLVYVASDLSHRRRAERIEHLDNLFHEIAVQSQVPLSLCFSWLRRLHRDADGARAETLVRVLSQLNKVRLAFDRLNMFEREDGLIPFNPVLLDLGHVLEGVWNEMPTWQHQQVDLYVEPGLPPVYGDFFQLAFCLRSTLSYLLEFVPPQGRVGVGATSSGSAVLVTLSGLAPPTTVHSLGSYADEEWSSHALAELTLAKDTMQRFMEKHGGTFEQREHAGEEVEFRLAMPAASLEAA